MINRTLKKRPRHAIVAHETSSLNVFLRNLTRKDLDKQEAERVERHVEAARIGLQLRGFTQ
jgi:hypothetical protein